MDWTMALAACGVGIVVGLTGMGGGALLTPVIVLLFNVPPLTAVSSDLVAAAVMKPVGSWVHFRRGTVNLKLVGWLCVGSVPAAFCGVLIAKSLGNGENVQNVVKTALAVALLVGEPLPQDRPRVTVRPVPTVIIGIIGGVVVGMTSVGSGSLIIISLMMLYPGLKASELVGTDLVQAVPLVMSAAFGHILFGDFQLAITLPLLVGSIPGVYVGAHMSARLPGGVVRRALAFVLLASSLKLFDVSTKVTAVILLVVLMIAPPVWWLARRRVGLPARAPGMLARRRRTQELASVGADDS